MTPDHQLRGSSSGLGRIYRTKARNLTEGSKLGFSSIVKTGKGELYMVKTIGVMLVTALVVLGLGTLGYADNANNNDKHKFIRSNWVPNVGGFSDQEQPLGDLWTFKCPEGGMITAAVDTKDDRDTGESNIDPILEVLDGTGSLLAVGDDEEACTYPPVCGFDCPMVQEVPCGKVNPHSLLVRDFGTVSINEDRCAKGGGYELTLKVFNQWGEQVSEEKVHLGGGAKRDVPDWAVAEGKAPVGPALDDENVPLRTEFPDKQKK
jgi:hypothetical protein